jgi:hypothetical protein
MSLPAFLAALCVNPTFATNFVTEILCMLVVDQKAAHRIAQGPLGMDAYFVLVICVSEMGGIIELRK